MKKGFSLIMAVIFMVILAILGTMALNFSTQTAKQTTGVYIREQAEILAINSTQYAVMMMQDHDYSVNCLERVVINYPNSQNPILRATVDIRYFDSRLGTDGRTCQAGRILSNKSISGGDDYENIALLDTVVESVGDTVTEPIRFHRRTIQRP